MAAAKLIVTATRGGSQITLVGASGTPLLSSKVFREPRGKGATLRALKGLLSEHVAVHDQTADPVVTKVAPAARRRPRSIARPVTAASKKRGRRAASAS